MKNLLPPLDKGLAALLEDLAQTRAAAEHDRGLVRRVRPHAQDRLEPPVERRAPSLSARLLGGGGRRRIPRRHGASAPAMTKGEFPKERPVHPWDLAASMYKLLGIEPNEKLPHPQGCVAYVTPLASGKVPSGGLLTEIM